MLRHAIIAFVLLCPVACLAQHVSVSGLVVDAATGKPLAGASVFFTSTSIGASSAADGTFTLGGVPRGKFDLVVSLVGYTPGLITVNTEEKVSRIEVRLMEKPHELEGVTLQSYDPDGWRIWGRFFFDVFIGTGYEAKRCTIENHEVIRFRYSKRSNTLVAFADEPIHITNRALGYSIDYTIVSFKYDSLDHILTFSGYPFYHDLPGSDSQKKRWAATRRDAYNGSLMHFLRTLYADSLREQQFDVKNIRQITADEKKRVRPLLLNMMNMSAKTEAQKPSPDQARRLRDSIDYYNAIIKGQTGSDLMLGKLIGPNDVLVRAGQHYRLDFPDRLQVIYEGKSVPTEYLNSHYPNAEDGMNSRISLSSDRPVELYADGYYSPSTDLLVTGFWAWYEKLSVMLPYDYKP